MPDVINFDKLPDHFGHTARAATAFNRQLFIASIPRLLHPITGLREHLVLRNFHYGRRFYLGKESQGSFFVFLKRKIKDKVVMNCQVDFTLVPRPKPLSATAAGANVPIIYRWTPPPFLVLERTEIMQALYSFDVSSAQAKRNWIVLAVGQDYAEKMVIQLENNEQLSSIGFRDKKYPIPIPNDQAERPESENIDLPAAPFLAFYQSLRTWMEEGNTATSQELMIDQSNDVRNIVYQLATAFRSIRTGLAATPAEAGSKLEQLAQAADVHYDVEDYQSNIVLRLDKKGALALRNARRSFQLKLDLDLSLREDHYEALVRMLLPDFLIKGELYEAFWEALCEEETIRQLKPLFRESQADRLLDDFSANKRGGAAVLRINRELRQDGKRTQAFVDTNLFVWEMETAGERHPIMLSGKFLVDTSSSTRKVSLYKKKKSSSLMIRYQAGRETLDKEVTDYFTALIAYMQNWMEVL